MERPPLKVRPTRAPGPALGHGSLYLQIQRSGPGWPPPKKRRHLRKAEGDPYLRVSPGPQRAATRETSHPRLELLRPQRLLTDLLAEVERRASTYSAARADTLTGYRDLAGRDDPRLFLLLDGLVAFRSTYEGQSTTAGIVSQLQRVLAEGRAVGIHVVVIVEQPGGLPTSMASAVGKRLVLRQVDENASAQLGIPKDVFSGESPPVGPCCPGPRT